MTKNYVNNKKFNLHLTTDVKWKQNCHSFCIYIYNSINQWLTNRINYGCSDVMATR